MLFIQGSRPTRGDSHNHLLPIPPLDLSDCQPNSASDTLQPDARSRRFAGPHKESPAPFPVIVRV